MAEHPFNDYLSIKMEPEIRHVLAHIMFAVECLTKNCPIGAMDNIKSIEGLVMFDGDDPKEWEKYYKSVTQKRKVVNKMEGKKSGSKKCKGKGGKCSQKSGKKCKGKK